MGASPMQTVCKGYDQQTTKVTSSKERVKLKLQKVYNYPLTLFFKKRVKFVTLFFHYLRLKSWLIDLCLKKCTSE